MAQFSDLHIKTDGVGDYDLNRFRIAFRSADFGVQYLASLFVNGFVGYFNGPAATVEAQGDKFKFHGDVPIGLGHYVATPHPDWVRVIYKDPRMGFTVQTLHRDTLAKDDFITAGAAGAGGGLVGARVGGPWGAAIGALAVGTDATIVNRYHFLAGRRSWRLDLASVFGFAGHDPANDVMILETAAIERFSRPELLPLKAAMRPLIVEIWSHLLTRFAAMPQVQVLSAAEWPLEPGWLAHGKVHYAYLHDANPGKLLATPDGAAVQHLFPLIYEG